MLKFIKSLFFSQRFFISLFSIAAVFLLSAWLHFLYLPAWLLLIFLVFLVLTETLTLYKNKAFKAKRVLTDKFSNSDENPVLVQVENAYNFSIDVEVIDEIPIQFQKRDFYKRIKLQTKEKSEFTYLLTPKERGTYVFGAINCFVSSPIRLIKRRYRFDADAEVKVYPSYIQMQALAFLALDRQSDFGAKKIRRIGHTLEFEQIKEYVPGDDVRTINWKTTAKYDQLMVNQYQDEKSQPIYNIIDRGRLMKMPFESLSLLDYAINSTLAFSNIALKKNDKIGLMTFAEDCRDFIKATDKKTQLNRVLEKLYNIESNYLVSDFQRLYAQVKRSITQRSMLLVYTNFEHQVSLERQLPYLRALSRKHLVVVVLFENTEIDEMIHAKAEDITSVYEKTVAEKFSYEKRLMVKSLNANGIQSILTKPQDLSVNTINKYLEIKAKGLI
ncbi:DUF58 domain-containing protein [Psychroflexus halocasei]|uniref:Uncharacterized conserved protein, DUF58 family, contains vWF domain n=1 Tax=Psychroflexus halocasei TaxID=908615 RepID=A0A1H4DK56_9FLAO|nr:DUF58 domain-containing protein [Psychroflexus halocasei]SEA73094.1 Uncharacterized conserved protein, DUF58 family, contains vWF domain [Psychroflexus halocasei]